MDTKYTNDTYCLTVAEMEALPRRASTVATVDVYMDGVVIGKDVDGNPVAA